MKEEQEQDKEKGFWRLVSEILADNSDQLKEVSNQIQILSKIIKEKSK